MVTDSNVKLSLIDRKTNDLLMVSSHGTKFENSYWMTPVLPRTLLDATDGALNAMEKKLNQIQTDEKAICIRVGVYHELDAIPCSSYRRYKKIRFNRFTTKRQFRKTTNHSFQQFNQQKKED
jgi:hypothetical protein